MDINRCAKTRGKQAERDEALKIAYDTFKELENSEYDQPNFITFSVFMKACHYLLPKSDMRSKLMEVIFNKACAAGQVEQSVLRQFQFSSPELFYKTVLNQKKPKGAIKYLSDKMTREILKDLPYQWTRNVNNICERKRSISV